MSYFKGLKLTKKGEQLLAKINGNLSETLTFKRAELGSGEISSDDEIRFLTGLKAKWKDVNISDIKIVGEESTQAQIELQFDNAGLSENKIFRELGIYASGNDDVEVLFAYTNAGENYDYIPLAKDNPQSFIINLLITITSNTKVNASIDLNSYVSLRKFNEELNKKANKNTQISVEEGLTGGGDLSEDISIGVDSLTDEELNELLNFEVLKLDDYTLAEERDIKNLFAGAKLLTDTSYKLGTISTEETKILNMKLLSLYNDLIIQKMNSSNTELEESLSSLKSSLENMITALEKKLSDAIKLKADKNISISGDNSILEGGGTLEGNRTIIHKTGAGYKHIPSGGAAKQFLKWLSNGTAGWDGIDWSDIENIVSITLGTGLVGGGSLKNNISITLDILTTAETDTLLSVYKK